MTLAPGSKIGPFDVVAPLGAGGMGEVYRAHDSRLERDVAIKALPEAFAADPERLARFEREARLLASLHHGNIAGIHGLEVVDGRRYLVLEYVEGETLAARLRRGPFTVTESIEVGRAIAAALEVAHESGIVHRDLKPGNVMLTPGGDVKVLDFGLAKGGSGASSTSNADLSASPTMTYAGTVAGVILGTAAYMSPEQARGKAVDRRADVWSFGCLLFECLTGLQTFAGETVSDIVARILQTEPEWAALPPDAPERLRALLRRCLEKDLKRRQRDMGDVRLELEDLQATRSTASGSAIPAPRAHLAPLPAWALVAIGAVLASAATWGALRALAPPAAAHAVRFEVTGPKDFGIIGDGAAAQISPDGQMVALNVADSSGRNSLWIRRLDSLTPHPLPGTENTTVFFWSPDSRFVAFFAGDKALSRVSVAGGEVERICDVKAARGGTWGRDGVILLAPYSNGGIYRVSANGGDPVAVTRPDSAHGETGHRFPVFLPDGRHFVFVSVPAGPDGKGGLYVGSLDGKPPRPIKRVNSGAIYCAPGWLLTTRDNTLIAQRFDAGAQRLIGEPVSLGDTPSGSQYTGSPVVSASATGALAYLPQSIPITRLAWLDQQGRPMLGLPVPNGPYANVRLSPDARRALLIVRGENSDVYVALADLERGTVSRLSAPGEAATAAAWSPDGHRVAYLNEANETIVVRSLVDGSSQSFLASDHSYKKLEHWSQDGTCLMYDRLDATTKWDVWRLPLNGGAPEPLVHTAANEDNGVISPDGRWVAFTSDETGTKELYVQAVGSGGLKYQVSTGGAAFGFWSQDGKTFVFTPAREPGVLRRAEVRLTPEFSLGPSSVMVHLPPDFVDGDSTPDFGHIIALFQAQRADRQSVVVLQNWQEALRRP
jgi:eukaryotic-like serine/threonine-protein kinase